MWGTDSRHDEEKMSTTDLQAESHHMELARAFVPWQRYTKLWEPMEGLAKGTIFPDLYQPFKPGKK